MGPSTTARRRYSVPRAPTSRGALHFLPVTGPAPPRGFFVVGQHRLGGAGGAPVAAALCLSPLGTAVSQLGAAAAPIGLSTRSAALLARHQLMESANQLTRLKYAARVPQLPQVAPSPRILSGGFFRRRSRASPITWSIAQTGDYNGDGMSDLLWRDTSGNTSMWFMNGTAVASTGAVGNIPTTWTVQSVNAE
jgi:hypothetical protein